MLILLHQCFHMQRQQQSFNISVCTETFNGMIVCTLDGGDMRKVMSATFSGE